ncbi:MAG TPA: hypothetical protein VH702_09775 [Vicinamibacterales bacterium]|jgi:hypothetical protein
MGIFIVLILVLFPIVFLFDTRFAAVALIVAIIGLYHNRTNRVRKPQKKSEEEDKAWEDPWNTSGLSS